MIRSHVIPRKYLAQFTDSEGALWVYSPHQRARRGTPYSEAAQKGYFAYVRNEQVDESMEAIAQRIETSTDDIIPGMANDCYVLSSKAKELVARYVALMFCRTVARRNASTVILNQLREKYRQTCEDPELLRRAADSCEVRTGRVVTPAALRETILRVIDEAGTKQGAGNMFVQTLLPNAKKIQELLVGLPWQIWKSDSVQFITTDVPVITLRPDSFGALTPGWGFARRDVMTLFPLKSNACLLIGNNGPYCKYISDADANQVNEFLVACMLRFAYSATNSPKLQQAVDDLGGVVRYLVNAYTTSSEAVEMMGALL